MNRISILVTLAALAACNGASPGESSDAGASAAADGAVTMADARVVNPDASALNPDSGPAALDASGDLGDAASSGDSDAAVVTAADAGATLHVLFIGNSITYVNDLPGMLSQIAATAGVPPAITTDEVVQGGATLQDQWKNGIAQTRITTGQWTHVVLQGQTEEAAAAQGGLDCSGYEMLGFSSVAQEFGNLIISANARPTLFASWAWADGASLYDPSSLCWSSPDEMQDWITFNYAEVGRRLPGSILSCVGEAFRASLRDHPEIVLIQSDLNHATVAGTYLAASTFYVALTGNPVPPASEVPSEVSPQDAELLRQEALVGSNCADVHPKADVVMLDCAFAGNGNYGCTCASIGACPFDFGVAGTSLPDVFLVDNLGLGTAGITDGLTLAPPFAWTSGAYPGGSGTVSSAGIQYDFCSTSLPAGAICALSVSYDGTTEGNGTLTLNLTDAYSASVAGKLHGSPTTRALLTVSEDSGFFGCSDTNCNGPVGLFAGLGTSVPISFVVSNRGGAPTTSLGVGTPPSPPFYWGPSGTSGTFPGGSGSGVVGGVTYDYCATQTLGAGQQCMVTVSLLAVTGDAPPFTGAVNLAYSDAQGPVLPNANRDLKGGWPMPP